ncbi:MAG: hypothetical protein ACI4RS_04605 [Monoglobaceae bacterium]
MVKYLKRNCIELCVLITYLIILSEYKTGSIKNPTMILATTTAILSVVSLLIDLTKSMNKKGDD